MGAGASQIVTLVAIPVVTRLYTPADFGAASFFLAIASVITPVASLRYEQAIALPGEDAKGERLTHLALLSAAAIAGAIALGLVLFDSVFGLAGAARGLGRVLYLLPVYVLAAAAATILAARLTRYGVFRLISGSGVAAASTVSGTRVGLGVAAGSSVTALVLGSLLGEIARVAAMIPRSREGLASVVPLRAAELRRVGTEFSDFPRLSAPTGLLNAFARGLPVLALTFLFGPAVVGIYALAAQALRLPLDFAAEATRRVFLQRAAQTHNRGGSLTGPYLGLTVALFVLGAVPLAVLALFAEEVFALVFGTQWTGAGAYARALLPWLCTVMPLAPANALFFVARRLGWWLGFQVAMTLLGASVFGVAWWAAWEPVHTVSAMSWCYFAVAVVTMLFGVRFASAPETAGPDPLAGSGPG